MLWERFHDLFSVKVFSASSALISGRRVRLRSITLRFSYSRGGFYKLSLWDELKPVFFLIPCFLTVKTQFRKSCFLDDVNDGIPSFFFDFQNFKASCLRSFFK